ncbi:MAG: MFS transporter [Alphaproteobacteria bacterium]|nr:MFS transporter [Alphaproteobacteria bacterium]
MQKPQLNFWQIWNMCFGFMGIQFGFMLQNSNVSRIFQTLGATMDELPILWVAAPLTGLIVQPIIGYMSDRTWNSLGRRRPFFLAGALLSSIALIVMPNSPTLWIAAGMLWVMDASINVAMEPFRAFVGDMLPERQRTMGFAMQSFFIGIGSVVASALPWMLKNWFDVSNTAEAGMIPDAVKWSFYIGGAALFLAVLWTILRTKEYSPEELRAFAEASGKDSVIADNDQVRQRSWVGGMVWLMLGLLLTLLVINNGLAKELLILTIGSAAFGVIQLGQIQLVKAGRTNNGFVHIIDDLFNMPEAMKQLTLVQFFSWFALFSMWTYWTAAVASHHFGSMDTTSQAYNDGADWVGVLGATYNGFAALAAIVIAKTAERIGRKKTYLINMTLGGLGLISFMFITDPNHLLISMIGVGVAWASILSIPYSLLSSSVPPEKMGTYMGIFNFFIVIPQLTAASVLGVVLRTFFDNQPIYAIMISGILMILAGWSVLIVKTETRA